MAWLLLLLLQAPDTLANRVDQLDATDPETRETAEHALAEAGERARPLLEQASKGDAPEGSTRARRLLRLLNVLAATPPVILEHVPEFCDGMRAGSAEERRTLLFTKLPPLMGGYLADTALQGLYLAALSDPDASNRVLLASKLAADPDGRVAAIALQFLRDPEASEYDSLRTDGKLSPDLIRSFTRRLALAPSVSVRNLEALLTNSNAFIRETGVEALRCRRHWDSWPAVEPLLDDGYGFVVVAAIDFLNEAGHPPGTERCLKVIREAEPWAGLAAIRVLVHAKAKEAAPELMRRYWDLKNEDLAASLLDAASELDPVLAESEAVRLAQLYVRDRGGERFRAYTAARCLARLHRPEHVYLALAVCIKAAKDGQLRFSGGDPLAGDLAECASTSALSTILDLCEPARDRHRAYGGNFMSDLAWAICDHVDQAPLIELCLRRVRDEALETPRRLAAAQMLSKLAWHDEGLREAAIAIVADRRFPSEIRKAFLDPLFWPEPGSLGPKLNELAARVLRDAADPVRMELVRRLLSSSSVDVGPLLAQIFHDDIKLAIPEGHWPYRPVCGALTAVIQKRLRTRDRDVTLAALQALGCLRDCDCDEDVARLLLNVDVDVRRSAAAIVRMRHGEKFREALRAAAAKEDDDIVRFHLIEAAILLNDRPAFEVLNRRVTPGTAVPWAYAMVRLGTREEILTNERRLLELAPAETVDAIARDDALRVATWAIRSKNANVRAAGARVIGEARIESLLPALRAMARSEIQQVREEAFRALGKFDRSVWLPAWRAALQCPGYDAARAMCAAVAEKRDPDLARTLLPLLREHARDWLGPAYAHAIDACVNGKALASWMNAKRKSPATLAALVSDLRQRELRVEVSESARAYDSKQLAASSDDWFIEVDGHWRRFTVGFAHVSADEGVQVMTLEEASAYWERTLR